MRVSVVSKHIKSSNSSSSPEYRWVNPDPRVTFGASVRARRQKLALIQERLAELTDLDPNYISGIERGCRNPSLKNIVKDRTRSENVSGETDLPSLNGGDEIRLPIALEIVSTDSSGQEKKRP